MDTAVVIVILTAIGLALNAWMSHHTIDMVSTENARQMGRIDQSLKDIQVNIEKVQKTMESQQTISTDHEIRIGNLEFFTGIAGSRGYRCINPEKDVENKHE